MPDDFPYDDFEQNGIRVLRGEELQAALDKMSDGPFLEGPIEACGPIRSGQGRLASITCPACGRTSYNPKDAEERYCGNCHDWHDNLT